MELVIFSLELGDGKPSCLKALVLIFLASAISSSERSKTGELTLEAKGRQVRVPSTKLNRVEYVRNVHCDCRRHPPVSSRNPRRVPVGRLHNRTAPSRAIDTMSVTDERGLAREIQLASFSRLPQLCAPPPFLRIELSSPFLLSERSFMTERKDVERAVRVMMTRRLIEVRVRNYWVVVVLDSGGCGERISRKLVGRHGIYIFRIQSQPWTDNSGKSCGLLIISF
jgi:hypothetical protein